MKRQTILALLLSLALLFPIRASTGDAPPPDECRSPFVAGGTIFCLDKAPDLIDDPQQLNNFAQLLSENTVMPLGSYSYEKDDIPVTEALGATQDHIDQLHYPVGAKWARCLIIRNADLLVISMGPAPAPLRWFVFEQPAGSVMGILYEPDNTVMFVKDLKFMRGYLRGVREALSDMCLAGTGKKI